MSEDKPQNGEILSPAPQSNGGRFVAGNKRGVGNRGPWAARQFMTQELISQLSEVDPKTNKAKFGKIIEQLIKQATGYVIKKTVRDKETGVESVITEEIPADRAAIEYIFDRLEGKPKQNMGFEAGAGGKLTIIFEPIDKSL